MLTDLNRAKRSNKIRAEKMPAGLHNKEITTYFRVLRKKPACSILKTKWEEVEPVRIDQ